jgi:hypothetical protein
VVGEGGVIAAQPLNEHGRMLFLLVAIVREYAAQFVISRRFLSLAVPVDRFQLFHERDNGAVPVKRRNAKLFTVLV